LPYRKSTRHSSHSPHSPMKPNHYHFYLQPRDSFESVQSSLHSRVTAIESEVRTYLTQVEERIGNLKFRMSVDQSLPQSPHKPLLSPIKTPVNLRSSSENPKSHSLPLNLRRSRALPKPPRAKKDSLTALMQSDGFEEDWNKVEHIVEKLKADRSVLPAPCLDDLLEQVRTRQQLQDAYKRSIWPSYAGNSALDVFSTACEAMGVAPVPAIAKVAGSKLVLNRYQLQNGLCKALAKAIPALGQLKTLHLDQNAISDAGGAALIAGVAQQHAIQSFFYTRNELGLRVAEELAGLTESNVTEICFNGCKVVNSALPNVISAALRIKSLSKLSLSDIGLQESAISALISGLKRSKLSHLDLSYNQIPLSATKSFLTYLRRDTKLRYLDYSWNNLSSADNEVAYMLGAILRAQSCLVHLNLGSTQLGEEGVRLVVQGVRKSRTLVGVHLTGNGVSGQLAEYISRMLEAKQEHRLISDSASFRPAPLISSLPSVLPKRPHNSSPANLKVRDSLGRKQIAHRDSLINIHHSDSRDQDSCILSRVLGHAEIAEGGQWVVSRHCWVCERWSIFTFGIEESRLRRVESVEVLRQRLGKEGKVVLKGSFNDWEELPLASLVENEYSISLLLPPGEHKFWFLYNQADLCISPTYRSEEERKIKLNRVKIPIRTVDVELMLAVREEKARVFDKNKSVFKAFSEDTDALVDQMFANDMKHSKISRVVKEESEFKAVVSLLRSNFKEIKEIFDNTAASSNYPTIGWLDFTDFSTMCQLLDKKFLNTAAIDRLFIAVNVELEAQDDNPNRELCRFEFFEIIVRIALCKYQELGISAVQSLKKLLEEHIFRYGTGSNAIAFRKEKLYQVEVNDVLEVNLFNIQSLFSSYKEARSKHVSLKSLKSLLSKSSLPYNDRDLMRDFAFSKMSVLDESNSNGAHEKMVFVEFLEFLGRFSETAVREDVPLWVKIEQVLDSALPAHGMKRKPVSELARDDED